MAPNGSGNPQGDPGRALKSPRPGGCLWSSAVPGAMHWSTFRVSSGVLGTPLAVIKTNELPRTTGACRRANTRLRGRSNSAGTCNWSPDCWSAVRLEGIVIGARPKDDCEIRRNAQGRFQGSLAGYGEVC